MRSRASGPRRGATLSSSGFAAQNRNQDSATSTTVQEHANSGGAIADGDRKVPRGSEEERRLAEADAIKTAGSDRQFMGTASQSLLQISFRQWNAEMAGEDRIGWPYVNTTLHWRWRTVRQHSCSPHARAELGAVAWDIWFLRKGAKENERSWASPNTRNCVM